ncbi:MAG: glycosyltransferase family 2 protein [Muribaculaceae bacterium]|nr:glycosyltransferase family 2 protein [Muribaculaceae bacterium]
MINTACRILDDVVGGFFNNITLEVMVTIYFYLVFVEFPRYYLLETIIVLWRKLNYRAIRREKKEAREKLYIENPLVTILAPGRNEGKHIYKLVCSLREQTYRNYEVIIVDDGSDDDTELICRDLEKAGLITHYIRSEIRGGKASAANMGLGFAQGKYVIHLDADSSLDRDAIEKILIPFYYDPRIKAVGGVVKVRNPRDSVCTSMQALEYLKTIQVGRMVTSTLGILHIISGAFGAFEREALNHLGGWDIGPGLDGDLTQKFRKAHFRVHFAEDAICMTSVPVSWPALFRQRQRWSKSLVRFRLRKHADLLRPHRHFSFRNFFSNVEAIMYDFVFNYVWFFYILVLIMEHPDRLAEIFIIGYLIRIIFNFIAFGVIMLVTERPRDEAWLIKYVPLSTFYTGYFLRISRLVAHTKEVFFFSSYKDPWNPRKTSEVAQAEGI